MLLLIYSSLGCIRQLTCLFRDLVLLLLHLCKLISVKKRARKEKSIEMEDGDLI